MKAAELYFHGVLIIMLYKVALPFEPVYEMLRRGHSSETLKYGQKVWSFK